MNCVCSGFDLAADFESNLTLFGRLHSDVQRNP